MTRPWTALVFVAAAISAAGCGYNRDGASQGYQWSSLYRQDVQTVAVPIFTNATYHRGIEFQLTEAVIKNLEAYTPYKAAPRERAETVLEGHVTSVDVRTISRDRQTNVAREQMMSISVDLVWKDLRDGRILAQRRGLRQSAVFYPTLAEGQFLGSQSAVQEMALAIVQTLEAEW